MIQFFYDTCRVQPELTLLDLPKQKTLQLIAEELSRQENETRKLKLAIRAMRIHLGGHLSWYDSEKRDWVERSQPVPVSLGDLASALAPLIARRGARGNPPLV